MARQFINIGAAPNDGNGTPMRDAFDMVNDNFLEVYGGYSGLSGNLGVGNVRLTGNQVILGDKTFSGEVIISTVLGVPIFNVNGDGFITMANDNNERIFSTEEYFLADVNGDVSVYWNDRYLSSTADGTTLNWELRNLQGGAWTHETAPTVGNQIANKTYVDGRVSNVVFQTGDQSVSGVKTFNSQVRFDGGATGDVLTVNRLYCPFTETIIDLTTRQFYSISGGAVSLDWDERGLITSAGDFSIDWDNKIAYGSDGNDSLNYGLRVLSGDWQTNTLPTTSGHIVNKGYLDTRLAASTSAKQKSLSVFNPASGDSVTLFYTSSATQISRSAAVVVSPSTGQVTWNVRYAATRNAAGSAALGANSVTVSQSAAQLESVFAAIPIDNWVWLTVNQISGAISEFHVTFDY